MKKPVIVIQPSAEPDIEGFLEALTVPQLTALLKQAEQLREQKLADAKRDLIAEYRAKAAALGLSLEEIVEQAKPKTYKRTHTSVPFPDNWQRYVINYLEKHEGRAPVHGLYKAVWPQVNAGTGATSRLRSALATLVKDGVLVVTAKGAKRIPTHYGLASMIEAEDAAE